MSTVSQSQILSDLNFLLGNTTVPTAITDQEDYIQRALQRIYYNYRFPMNTVLGTIQMNTGIGTLPSNVGQDGLIDVREVNVGPYTDNVYIQVSYQESNNYATGDYA